MFINTPQSVQWRSELHRILIYIGSFTCATSGGASSGEEARLQFNIYVNDEIIHTFYVDYDESNESDIITNFVLTDDDLESGTTRELYPEDVIKVEMLEDFESEISFSYDDIVFKILAPKMRY